VRKRKIFNKLGIANLARLENLEELLIKQIFNFYCVDGTQKMKSKNLKVSRTRNSFFSAFAC
jgi:hypothetical protein